MVKKSYGFVSLLVLLAAYCFVRYPMFNLHGMRQWPLILFIIAMIVSCVSMLLKNNIVPMFTALGYVIGFGAGVLFHSIGIDAGGGARNTLWLIWTVVMFCCTMTGMIIFLIKAKQRK